jgi:hypothetical protein
MQFNTWLDTFLDEKRIDLGRFFDIEVGDEFHLFTYGAVAQAIKAAPAHEQAAIQRTLVKIDFINGDVYHFLRHLGEALAHQRQAEGAEA